MLHGAHRSDTASLSFGCGVQVVKVRLARMVRWRHHGVARKITQNRSHTGTQHHYVNNANAYGTLRGVTRRNSRIRMARRAGNATGFVCSWLATGRCLQLGRVGCTLVQPAGPFSATLASAPGRPLTPQTVRDARRLGTNSLAQHPLQLVISSRPSPSVLPPKIVAMLSCISPLAA